MKKKVFKKLINKTVRTNIEIENHIFKKEILMCSPISYSNNVCLYKNIVISVPFRGIRTIAKLRWLTMHLINLYKKEKKK